MVDRLDISNFKSIRQQQVQLGRINLLIGQNGAGKSNFIGVFAFLEKLVARELADYIARKGGFEDFVRNGLEDNDWIKLAFRVFDENAFRPYIDYSCLLRALGTEYYLAEEEFDSDLGGRISNLNTGRGKEMRLYYREGDPARMVVLSDLTAYLRTLRVYHFHDTSDNARVKLPQDAGNGYYLQSEAENLAPFLYNLQQNHPTAYADIVAAVRLVYPPFTDFFLRESLFAKGKMELQWRERGNEAVLHARQLSDGTLRFICLAALLLQPPPAALPDSARTLVLDEPELGLHPFALHVLAELLHKAAVHRQVIVATQSVGLLNYFTPEDLLIVERGPEGDTVFARKTSAELREWLSDYTLGQLWEANLLGGRP